MPRIVACGSRADAYKSFCTAIANNELAMLLVDSEARMAAGAEPSNAPSSEWLPWLHLKQRQGDGWDRPANSDDLQCHLMVQCMEHWLLADRDALRAFFGKGYRDSALPSAQNPLEGLSKQSAYSALANATRDCQTKGTYGKGQHSFELLGKIDPQKVMAASPWAKRFITALKERA
jgi:hypothetical protein